MTDGRPTQVKRTGIIEVAEMAGVSRQTVTRAMNGMPGISAATKQRVLDAARTLRYRPSRFGRGLVNPDTSTLGLVVVDLTNPYFSQLASSVLEFASERGWMVHVVEKAHGGVAALEELGLQVDAVVGYFEVDDAEIDRIFGDIPLVTFDRWPSPGGRAAIDIDFEPGMRLALKHFIEQGRRKTALLDSTTTHAHSARAIAYERISEELGLTPHVFRVASVAEPTMEVGMLAIADVLSELPDVEAIIGFNDIVAIGALKCLQLVGIQVPEQCSVLGIDGLPIGLIPTPTLSTMQLDMRSLGRAAMDLVVGMADGTLPLSGPAVHQRISHSLTLRDSA